MILIIKMCRFENKPWGFRLVGGSDFEYPLTVVKVTEGSIAEEAGLKVGDVIVRINDEPTSQLTHNQVHEVILNCGNGFFFGVNREEENDENRSPCETEVEQIFSPISPVPETNYSVAAVSPSENKIILNDDDIDKVTEKKITDDEIAELISSEAEVLKEHNVIGVNFNRIFPKPGVCMSSQVLRTLNDEAMKTRKEREKDKRKWTTFMQKPDRPIPKSKRELEEEKAKHTTSYTLVIKKQPKPKIAPDHVPTPPASPIEEKEAVEEKQAVEELLVEEEMAPLTDSEVPDLQPLNDLDEEKQGLSRDNENQYEEDKNQIRQTENGSESNNQENESDQNEIVEKSDEPEDISKITEKTEEELALERQLQDVQKQLLALSSLPSTIQATLDAVTKQLAELLPTFKLQQDNVLNNQNNIVEEKTTEEQLLLESEMDSTNEDIQNASFSETENEILSEKELEQLDEKARAIEEEEEYEREEKRIQLEELERKQNEEEKISQEIDHKKQQKEVFMDELQQRQKSRSKKGPSRPFGPLVPQTRPLILPGGRKWRTPKDAFNEDFIAETLSSQAELIVGSTLGSTYESPLLGYDEREVNCASLAIHLDKRVNFLKFQKPEKKIDLDKSEVYKVIHHMDRQPKRGIEVRPAKVPAEEDIRNKIQCG